MKLEVFEDRMYFDMFCVRPEGSSDFNDTIHFVRKADALVAMRVIESWIAAEREACAKVCDGIRYSGYCPPEDGGAPRYYNDAAEECADAIRARGNQ
jgi:hypothetical protein